jgi:hypothetical protein
MSRLSRFMFVALGTLAGRIASAQIVGPNGYIVGSITMPTTAQGDVEVIGTSIVVGQGSFGGGTESIVRRDADGGVTTLATGFNSLSSFALSPQGDLLFVSDNGGEQAGATTGDTVFAIDNPRAATIPVTAAGHEVAAAGTVPFAQGLAVGPDGELYVSNAAGGTAGSVLKHRSFLFPPFATLASGFGYTAGLAFGPNGHLFVGDVDGTTFIGRVVELDASGTLVHTLASGLSGAFDQAFDRDGNLLVSGGFTGDFSSSTIVSIDPTGTVSEFAHGFSFSGGLTVDSLSGRVYALDAGSSAVTTFTPIAALIPGGGVRSTDCFAEFSDAPAFVNGHGRPTTQSICHDGDACDRDGAADGVCTFGVGVCFNVTGSAQCTPTGVESFAVVPPPSGPVDPQFAALSTAAGPLMPSTTMECVGPFPVTVPTRLVRGEHKPGSKVLHTVTTHTPTGGRAQHDRDTLTLRCLP